MFKRKLRITDFFLIVVNLIPLYGVWFKGWDAKPIFLVYCMETLIIGAINLLKMVFVTVFVRSKDAWENGGTISMQSGWLFILFFILHYGFFAFIQTQLFFSISDIIPNGSFITKYNKIPGLLDSNGKLLLLLFVCYYILQNLFEFFASGNYKTISMGRLLFEPYLRIFIQQFVVVLGSAFLSFGAGKIFILIFITIKIFFDLFIPLDRILQIAEKRQQQKIERQNKN